MKFIALIFLIIPLYLFKPGSAGTMTDIAGRQPNIAVDSKGIIRVVYGEGETIWCITSANNGQSFSSPVKVGELKGMHLGSARGPQIASSKNYSLITAITKDGTIHSFLLNNSGPSWKEIANANDQAGSAPEGLMGLAADDQDNFYAVWLDIRSGKKNNIAFSSLAGRSAVWRKNVMVYRSPDEHVCECCKPNIAFSRGKLVVGFRNWLMGSRDIYYAVSADKGKTFTAPRKTGTGTWQLNGCPMDGGGLAVSENGKVSSAWRRNSDVYYWAEDQPEQKIGSGKDVSMAQQKGNTFIAWQDGNNIKVMDLGSKKTVEIGKGVSPRLHLLGNGRVICVWEDNNVIRHRLI